LGLRAPGRSDEGRTIYPRYNILDAILVEIERRTGAEFTSREDVTRWLIAASRAAYEEETRPPDLVFSNISETFSPDFQERIRALGPKAKIVGGQGLVKDRAAQHRAMEEECDAFATYLTRLTEDDLVLVAPLPHRRTLDDSESDRLWSLLASRWGVDGQWYPLDWGDEAPPRDTVAFRADPFFDKRVVQWLQHLLKRDAAVRVYELREGGRSADYEIDVELLRPWYTFDEGYWLDDSADWIVYASHEGSVTIGGARLLPALQEVWNNWHEYLYVTPEAGVERQVGPGVMSITVSVEPPPEWEHPTSS
jgi:hypothetical protein